MCVFLSVYAKGWAKVAGETNHSALEGLEFSYEGILGLRRILWYTDYEEGLHNLALGRSSDVSEVVGDPTAVAMELDRILGPTQGLLQHRPDLQDL